MIRRSGAVALYCAVIFSALGLFAALVLSISEAHGAIAPCGGMSGCGAVAASPYSRLGGVPVAYVGAFAYALAMLLALLSNSFRQARAALTALTCAGFLASLALISISYFFVHAVCLWCVASAAAMTLLFISSILLVGSTAGTQARGLWLLAGILGPCAVAGAFLVSRAATPRLADPQALAEMTLAELAPADLPSEGDPSGAITLVEFSDFACPACRDVHTGLERLLLHTEGIHLVYRHLPHPWIRGHEASAYGAVASVAALRAGKFWEFADKAFAAPAPTRATYDSLLRQLKIGVDISAHMARLDDALVAQVNRDLAVAKKLRINLTPVFVVLSPELPPQVCTNLDLSSVLKEPEILQNLRRRSP